MWLVFLFLVLLLGILYSKVELNIYQLRVSQGNWNFHAWINFRLFGVFKIFALKLDKKNIYFLDFKIPYTKFFSKEEIKKFNKNTFEIFRKFHFEFDQIRFHLKVWIINIPISNLFVVVFSSLFPIIIHHKVKEKNLRYQVDCYQTPANLDSEILKIDLEGKITFSIKTLTFIKLYFKNIKRKFEHNKNKNYGVKESL